jgi:hypothetical protein
MFGFHLFYRLADNVMSTCLSDMIREACDSLVDHALHHTGTGLSSTERLSYVTRSLAYAAQEGYSKLKHVCTIKLGNFL